MRVGIPGHAAGVTVYHWCHPVCFAKHCLRVDFAPTGRAKCKGDGSQIPKGAIRLLIGYKKESTVYRVENIARTIVPELLTLVGATNMALHGLGELSLDDRLRVEGLVFGGGGGGGGAGGAGAGGAGGSSSGSSRCGGGKKHKLPAAAPVKAKKRARRVGLEKKASPKSARRAPRSKATEDKRREVEEDSDDGEVCD